MSDAGALTLRGATSDDADVVSRLLAELGYPVDPATVPTRLDALTRDGGIALLAVGEDSTPLGLTTMTRFATLHAPGPTAYITALVVTERAHGRGVGRALVDAAREWARANGCARLSVTSAERRSGAHAFYPACGIPYTGRRFSVTLDALR